MASYSEALRANENTLRNTAGSQGAPMAAAATAQPSYTKALAANSVQGTLNEAAGNPKTLQQAATYIDAAGERQTGYVQNKNKQDSWWDQQAQYYRDQYQAAVDAHNEQAAAAAQAAWERINGQIGQLNENYAGTNRQLYRDYMQQQRTLPQQLAAQGYTGGLTESSRLRLGNSYEEALNQNQRSLASEIAEYNAQGNQLEYEARAEAARLNAEADQQYRSYITALREQRRTEEREDLERRAAAMAAVGDFSLYKKLGYTDAQIRRLKKEWQRTHKKTSGGGSSGGRSGSRKNNSSGNDGGGTTPTIDYNSITALGRGPISAETLSRLVESGQVTETNNNGRITYTNTPTNTGNNPLDFRRP